jgi:mono/diheme cytochrome c family protein
MRMRLALVSVVLAALVSACGSREPAPAAAPPLGDPAKGKAAIVDQSCGVCHQIPGIEGAEGTVGQPLGGLASRPRLAGDLPNTPENVVRWIRSPQQIKPGSDMPDMDIEEPVARDIAAYLLSLK